MNQRKQINVRFTEAEMAKLESMKRETNMNFSEIIRKLIECGKINVRHDQKSIITQITALHDDFNSYCHFINEKHEKMKTLITQIEDVSMHLKDKDTINFILAQTMFLLNQWMEEFRMERQRVEMELNEIVNIKNCQQ